MATTGHADDCPACGYEQLPAEDRAALDETAFTRHTRQEPPAPPPLLPAHAERVAAAVTLLLFVLAAATMSVVMCLPVLAGIITAVGLSTRRQDRQKAVDDAWRPLLAAWQAEQTEAWLAARAQSRTWPCPSCGSLSCSNQHSVTTTETVRTGYFTYSSRSHSDPV